VVLAAAYLLWLYQRVFFGTVTNPKNEKLHDLTPREILTFAPLIVMALWIGLYPKPFFQILEQPVNQLVMTFQNGPNPNLPANAQVTPAVVGINSGMNSGMNSGTGVAGTSSATKASN
jgi:NADH-quinone oxidoreductase subunit M